MKTAQEIRSATGGYINAVPLQNVPGIQGAFGELLARVQALPFVPSTWSSEVRSAMEASGGNLWSPGYAIVSDAWRSNKSAPIYPEAPSWLQSNTDAAQAWNMLCDWWADRLAPILKGWARDEAEVLQAAYDDAVFWDRLYTVVKPVAAVGEAIIEAPAMVAEGASKALGGVLGKVWPWLLLAGALVVVAVVVKGKLTKPPAP